MERRILLAFALSFVVLALYLRLFAPAALPPGPAPAEDRPLDQVPAPEKALPGEARKPTRYEGLPAAAGKVADEAERRIEVDTPLYRARFSNRGAEMESFVLKEHRDQSGSPFEMLPKEASERLGIRPLAVELEEPEQSAALREGLYQTSEEKVSLGPEGMGSLYFRWADGRGLEALKRIGFSGGSYQLQVEISVRERGAELRKRVLFGPGLGEESLEGTYVQPEKGVIKAAGELRLLSAADIEEAAAAAVDVQATGLSAHYFAALMLSPPGAGYGARLAKQRLELGEPKRPREFITAALEAPGKPASFALFVGPKDHELLRALGPGMEGVIEYGPWLRYLVLPLRSALLWTYGYVGNYGWAIVLLTVAINVALVPLKHHSYVSMRKMQKLAPQVKRIQERYKKLKPQDPRRKEMNVEVLALYREHKVSPVSGCLPMLLMIPFFFAFYRLLSVAIELRHAAFVLWIQDLSTYDPYFALPALMGVSQLAVQWMSPQTSADPVQAKIMMVMPIAFVFFLAWAPSGLVLYWFVNNLVSIAQQVLTNRLAGPSAEEGTPGAGKPSRRAGR